MTAAAVTEGTSGASGFLAILLLYLRSRKTWQAVVTILATIALAWFAGGHKPAEDPMVPGDSLMVLARNQTWAIHLVSSITASLIGISVWSPFGETERPSPWTLNAVRIAHLGLLLVIVLVSVTLFGTWEQVMPGIEVVPITIRNTLLLLGLVLLLGRVIDVRLAALVPVGIGVVLVFWILVAAPDDHGYDLLWRIPTRNVLVHDQTSGAAWIATAVLCMAGVIAYVRWGAMVTDAAD